MNESDHFLNLFYRIGKNEDEQQLYLPSRSHILLPHNAHSLHTICGKFTVKTVFLNNDDFNPGEGDPRTIDIQMLLSMLRR